jgi:hypothetical protein
MPNTYILGAPKCGTTAMARYLSEHPGIFFSKLKEPGYWATDFGWLAERNGLRSLEDYLALFAEASAQQPVVGEASTMYLSSATAAANILAVAPDAKFIVMLRDPVEVAHAYHMQKLLMFHEDVSDFETAWRLQETRRRGERVPANCPGPVMLQYGEIAGFGPQVRRLLEVVPRDVIRFIRYDTFKADTAATYASTLEFLGIEHDGRSEFPVVGPARDYRFPLVARLFHDPPQLVRAPVRALRRHLILKRYPAVEALRQRMFKPRRREKMDPRFHAELREFFAPHVRELEQLLGWDLSDWRATPPASRSRT